MSNPMTHLSEWSLEQLAEGSLSGNELRGAQAHVEQCARCAAELDAYRALFTALAELPRFAPATGFSDAVLARVRVAPQTSPALARVRRWLPATRRGWMVLAAAVLLPVLPVLGAVLWLVTHPLVSPLELWQWTVLNGTELVQAARAAVVRWDAGVGVSQLVRTGYAVVRGLPMEALLAGAVAMGIAIPLSAWSLVRLVRTPMRNVTYAN